MFIKANLEKTLLFLVILLLPTQLGKHFWPKFSYIYSLRIDYLSPTLYLWDLLVLGLIIVWLLKRPKINQFYLTALLLFLLTQLVSLFNSFNIMAGLVRFEQFLICGLLGFYIANQSFKKIKNIVVWGLSLAVFYESLIALGEFSLGRSLGLWVLGERNFSLSTPSIATFNFYGQTFLRPYATFPHPNVLGGFMVTVFPLLILSSSAFKNLFSFLAVLAVIISFSRASLLVLFIEAIYFLKNKFWWFILILILTAPFLYVRFQSAFNFDNLSIIRREELAVLALNYFYHSPIFGIGLNNFINQTATSVLISGESRFLQPVHNIFLLVLSETGLLGSIGFLTLIFLPLKRVFKLREDPVGKMLLVSWGAILFLGLFDHYFLTLPQGYRLLFLIWGLSISKIND